MGENAEEWRPVVGYEGLYEVSDHGQVKSLSREIGSSYGAVRTIRERILRPAETRGEYEMVNLRRDGESKTRKVHRLVAEAFIGPPPKDRYLVRHLDGDSKNNRVENLAWGDSRLNSLDAVRHGTHQMTRRTHCLYGHVLEVPNLRSCDIPRARVCLTCRRTNDYLSRHSLDKEQHFSVIAEEYYRKIMGEK